MQYNHPYMYIQIKPELTCNVALVSRVQQSDSFTHTYDNHWFSYVGQASPPEAAGTRLSTHGCFSNVYSPPPILISLGVVKIQEAALPTPSSHLNWCIVVQKRKANRSFWKELWSWIRRPGSQPQLCLPFLGLSFPICAMK